MLVVYKASSVTYHFQNPIRQEYLLPSVIWVSLMREQYAIGVKSTEGWIGELASLYRVPHAQHLNTLHRFGSCGLIG